MQFTLAVIDLILPRVVVERTCWEIGLDREIATADARVLVKIHMKGLVR